MKNKIFGFSLFVAFLALGPANTFAEDSENPSTADSDLGNVNLGIAITPPSVGASTGKVEKLIARGSALGGVGIQAEDGSVGVALQGEARTQSVSLVGDTLLGNGFKIDFAGGVAQGAVALNAKPGLIDASLGGISASRAQMTVSGNGPVPFLTAEARALGLSGEIQSTHAGTFGGAELEILAIGAHAEGNLVINQTAIPLDASVELAPFNVLLGGGTVHLADDVDRVTAGSGFNPEIRVCGGVQVGEWTHVSLCHQGSSTRFGLDGSSTEVTFHSNQQKVGFDHIAGLPLEVAYVTDGTALSSSRDTIEVGGEDVMIDQGSRRSHAIMAGASFKF